MSKLVRDLQELELQRDRLAKAYEELCKAYELKSGDNNELTVLIVDNENYIEWLEAHHPDARKTYDALQKVKESAK